MPVSFGFQANPSARPSVVAGIERGRPRRLVVRPRFWTGRGVFGMVLLGLGAAGQVAGFTEGERGAFVVASLVSVAGALLALARRSVVLDRDAGLLQEARGTFLKVRTSTRPLECYREVRIGMEEEGRREGARTTYPVSLEGDQRYEVDRTGYWEAARGLAEQLAEFLGCPLLDADRSGRRAPGELNQPAHERVGMPLPEGIPPTGRFVRGRSSCTVHADEERVLSVTIPRPAVPLLVFLNVLIGVFLAVPFTVTVLWPLMTQGRMYWNSAAFFALPIVLVGTASLKIALTEGGRLDVTPARLKLVKNGLFGPTTVVIPGEELEDLAEIYPETGGSRTLLQVVSDGVLVARSDRASVRFGFGLGKGEVAWLRRRVLEVLGARAGRRASRPRAAPLPLHRDGRMAGLAAAAALVGAAALLPGWERWVPAVAALDGALVETMVAGWVWRRRRAPGRTGQAEAT